MPSRRTLRGPQSRLGDKSLIFQVVCPQNGTAVPQGLRKGRNETFAKPPSFALVPSRWWSNRSFKVDIGGCDDSHVSLRCSPVHASDSPVGTVRISSYRGTNIMSLRSPPSATVSFIYSQVSRTCALHVSIETQQGLHRMAASHSTARYHRTYIKQHDAAKRLKKLLREREGGGSWCFCLDTARLAHTWYYNICVCVLSKAVQ